MLEEMWDGRHGIHFSRMNHMMNPAFRDYFDRGREAEKVPGPPGVRPQVCWRPHWSLNVYEKRPANFNNEGPSAERGVPEALKTKSDRRGEGGWDNRFHITHSMANHLFHDAAKELFSRNVPPRSERVLVNQQKGITKHIYRHPVKHNPDGSDDRPSSAEALLADDFEDWPRGSPSASGKGLLPPLQAQPNKMLRANRSQPALTS